MNDETMREFKMFEKLKLTQKFSFYNIAGEASWILRNFTSSIKNPYFQMHKLIKIQKKKNRIGKKLLKRIWHLDIWSGLSIIPHSKNKYPLKQNEA